MSINETCQPINCDDYDNLELACQHHLLLTLVSEDGKVLQAKVNDLVPRKDVEYLVVDVMGETREPRLDRTASFSRPRIGIVVVSES